MDSAIKVLAWAVGGAYVLLGTGFLIVLGVGGLWEGFAHRDFVLRFLGIAAYVYGTAAVAYWVGARQSRLGLLGLAMLVIPVVVMAADGVRGRSQLEETARTAITAPEEATREAARRELLALGQRAGRQPHVDELVRLLERAESDAVRMRVVTLLGGLSYLYEGAIEPLRRLHADTRDDPKRADLHAEVAAALGNMDPYTPLDP